VKADLDCDMSRAGLNPRRFSTAIAMYVQGVKAKRATDVRNNMTPISQGISVAFVSFISSFNQSSQSGYYVA